MYIYITSPTSNGIFSPSNKIHREVGRAKDLSAHRYLTAVEAQALWSYGWDVNFLAAGYNAPSVGSAGSGIYAGRPGLTKTVIPTVPTTQLIVANVSKKTCQSSQSILNYVGNNSKAFSFSITFLAGLMEIIQDFGR
jgi:hypothetical protein